MFKNEVKLVEYEWKHYKTILIVLVILLTLQSFLTGSLQQFFDSLGSYGYLGGFVAGFLFT